MHTLVQCENAFHGSCLTPPIVGIPEGEYPEVNSSEILKMLYFSGEWFCSSCFTSNTQVGGDEEAEVVPAGKKRKAPARKFAPLHFQYEIITCHPA